MKIKDQKVLDFVKKTNDFVVILGTNGSGKTSKLKSIFNDMSAIGPDIKQVYISDSYIINSGQIVNYFISNTDIDSLESREIKNNDLKHLNTMISKEYHKVTYKTIDFDSFTDIFGNEIPEVDILFDRYSKNIRFFYVEVTDSEGRSYDSLSMGRGEYLSVVYFILFHDEIKKSKVYIDEPCNYLSYFSLQNFSKLLIKSSAVDMNEFYLTTNNLDLIDNLMRYGINLKLIFNYPKATKDISNEDYYCLFGDRYQKKEEVGRIICVEDILAKKFLKGLFPNEKIVFVHGEGNLRIVDRFSSLVGEFKFPEIRVIYDGDQTSQKFRLPFDDVETYVIHNYEKFIESEVSETERFKVGDCIKRFEKHDAYLEILKILNIREEQCLEKLVNEYKDSKWFKEISDYINNGTIPV